MTSDLLFELGTEELPPKSLLTLSQALAQNIEAGLKKAELNYGDVSAFATPRRLAVIVKDVETIQKTQNIERRGPALKAAFDADGQPTPACLGFASACGTTVEKLVTRETDKGAWLFCDQAQSGAMTINLLPDLIKQAIKQLPIPKPMRWGANHHEFIRPIHWAVLLFDKQCIETDLFGIHTGRNTYGHRFLHPEAISIPQPDTYEKLLKEQGYVIADFNARKQYIRDQIGKITETKGRASLDDALLNEVTGLVEWPVALLGEFDSQFLEVPAEAVMTAMQTHQKYFPVLDPNDQLLNYFVLISNIESQNPARVVAGNQRVIHARLSDAQFFYHSDLKQSLASRVEELKKIIFQNNLGTLFDKTERVAALTAYLAEKTQYNIKEAQRAGLLCKADLVTAMVSEFAELQGVMGYHYALHDGEPTAVALALREQYQPRFAGDVLPETPLGALLSIADKIDTLVGLFGVNQPPTGEKDPYALRRAALGVLRILIEKKLRLDLREILDVSAKLYGEKLENINAPQQVFDFMMERLRAWYLDKQIDIGVFSAVSASAITEPLDFHHRILAIQKFQHLPEAQALVAANKRVSQLLKNQDITSLATYSIDPALFEQEIESQLFALMEEKSREIARLRALDFHTTETDPAFQYEQILMTLAELQLWVDRFFNEVMVMVEDTKLRNNRLALLYRLRSLFCQVGDMALIS